MRLAPPRAQSAPRCSHCRRSTATATAPHAQGPGTEPAAVQALAHPPAQSQPGALLSAPTRLGHRTRYRQPHARWRCSTTPRQHPTAAWMAPRLMRDARHQPAPSADPAATSRRPRYPRRCRSQLAPAIDQASASLAHPPARCPQPLQASPLPRRPAPAASPARVAAQHRCQRLRCLPAPRPVWQSARPDRPAKAAPAG